MEQVALSLRMQVRDWPPGRCQPLHAPFSPALRIPSKHLNRISDRLASAYVVDAAPFLRSGTSATAAAPHSVHERKRHHLDALHDTARSSCDRSIRRHASSLFNIDHDKIQNIDNDKMQTSAETEMAILAKEESMPLNMRSVDREITHGTAFWADVRARLADTD